MLVLALFSKFEILKKALKRAKTFKKQRKKTSIFFLFMRFYLEGQNFINKNCLFYANFLNLKSLVRHLFFVVASSLSILCNISKVMSSIAVQIQKNMSKKLKMFIESSLNESFTTIEKLINMSTSCHYHYAWTQKVLH